MTKFDAHYKARDSVVNYLIRALQGDERDQVISETPNARFGLGKLYPAPDSTGASSDLSLLDTDEHDDELSDLMEQATEEDGQDYGPALAHMPKPSSIGLTFTLDLTKVGDLSINVEYVRYTTASGVVDTDPEIESASDEDQVVVKDSGAEWTAQITREAFLASELLAGVAWNDARTYTSRSIGSDPFRASLSVLKRAPQNGVVSVTLSLVNRATILGERNTKSFNEAMMFRPRITVRSPEAAFVEGEATVSRELNADDSANNLLYRDSPTLAIGHGCAVTWPEHADVSEISTTFFPQHELHLASPQVEARFQVGALSMSALGNGELEPAENLVSGYEAWISERHMELPTLPKNVQEQGEQHLQEAAVAAERIRNGIRLLSQDPQALQAFKLMNQAMFLQRKQQTKAKGRFTTDAEFSAEWYPFQLAFVLMNLQGLTDASSSERELVELLWFPTGGGKTEAYLGLIAYSIFLRRIRKDSDAGVSIIMRYTLRLLTIQQFERAAALICAMEFLRRAALPKAAQISIGLWVGGSATPNNVDEAKKALVELKKLEASGKDKGADAFIEGDPMQITACPWCNTKLGTDQYQVEGKAMVIRCADKHCPFAESLPVYTVDDDVYENRPSLIIGTVDKFAAIAWEERVRNLLSSDQEHSSPDLIIQDELHLISGPLGSMVGLYEVPIMAAASRTAPVKVIASTATIRNVKAQGRALYGRDTFQFPPPGLTAADSFFAHDASREEKGTRLYVGVSSPNLSQATLLIRVYAALLQAVSELPEETGAEREAKDTYWTLLGYFNALRILGGAVLQVYDDIPERIKYQSSMTGSEPRYLHAPEELTSRKNSGQLKDTLDSLAKRMGEPSALDVVLATNMVSVGVDVDRLGLMVVDGQPKTTAEYIQSSSRVGRSSPGLVVTLLNANKSRDISHYENFVPYHRALYRHVEPTSATPFALRSLDRGLHGALVGMARLSFAELASNAGATRIIDCQDQLRTAAEAFIERAKVIGVDAQEIPEIDAQLEDLFDQWYGLANVLHDDSRDLYFSVGKAKGDSLLVNASVKSSQDADVFPPQNAPWSTMRSLRNVDATVRLAEKLTSSGGVPTTTAPKPARRRQR